MMDMMLKKNNAFGMGFRVRKMILQAILLFLYFFIMLLPVFASAADLGNTKKTIQASPAVPVNQANQAAQQMLPVKISFNISPNPSYFWAAALSEDGNFSWAGLPSLITIRVGIGGPVYTIGSGTSMPFAINTGDIKFVGGSDVLVAVQIDSKNGYRVANKLYSVPVSNSVFNITMVGPSQPVVYKPAFNP